MTRPDFDALCATHPGAVLSGPGELDAWKVGGKMFACFGHAEARAANVEHVAVRCPDAETAAMLIDAGAAERAPYFQRMWVRLDLAALEPDEARHRIAVSYAAIRSGLPRRVRDALPGGAA